MLLLIVLLTLGLAVAIPSGVFVDQVATDTKPITQIGLINAQGGNFTELNISGETQTLAWQGYYGTIDANLTLSDDKNNTFYGWSAENLSTGKIFASRSSTVSWATIAAQNDCTVDESLTGTLSDRVNSTFSPSTNAEMLIGDINITANSTCAAWTYVNSTAQTDVFQELILTDGSSIVYAAFINQSTQGFDSNSYDFQMIIPETQNRSKSDYYFYSEFS